MLPSCRDTNTNIDHGQGGERGGEKREEMREGGKEVFMVLWPPCFCMWVFTEGPPTLTLIHTSPYHPPLPSSYINYPLNQPEPPLTPIETPLTPTFVPPPPHTFLESSFPLHSVSLLHILQFLAPVHTSSVSTSISTIFRPLFL